MLTVIATWKLYRQQMLLHVCLYLQTYVCVFVKVTKPEVCVSIYYKHFFILCFLKMFQQISAFETLYISATTCKGIDIYIELHLRLDQ